MFCEKCGTRLTGFEKECPKCGAEIVPEETEVKPEVEKPTDSSAEIGNANQPAQVVNSTPPTPREPMPKKKLIGIVVSCILAVAIIASCIVVVPIFTGVKMLSFVDYELDDTMLFEDRLVFNFHINESDAEEAFKIPDRDAFYGRDTDLRDIQDCCDIKAYKEGDEKHKHSESVNNLSSTDVVIIEIKWDEDDEDDIKEIEDELGININTRDSSMKVNIKDLLVGKKLQKAEVIDFFELMDNSKALKYDGYEDENIKCDIEPFSDVCGAYVIECEDGFYGASLECYIYNSADYKKGGSNESIGTFKVSADSISSLSNGESINIRLDRSRIDETNIILEPTEKEYKVKGGELLTAKTAKSGLKQIKKIIKEDAVSEDYLFSSEKYKLEKIKFFKSKSKGTDYDNIVVAYYKVKIDNVFDGKSTVYVAHYYYDFFKNDNVIKTIQGHDGSDEYKSMKAVQAKSVMNATFDSNRYKATTIFG